MISAAISFLSKPEKKTLKFETIFFLKSINVSKMNSRVKVRLELRASPAAPATPVPLVTKYCQLNVKLDKEIESKWLK